MTYLGGTTVVSLLLGEAPGWSRSPAAPLGVLFAWWATFFCPGDLWFLFYSSKPVQTVAFFLECVNTAYSIVYLGMWHAMHVGSQDYSLNVKHPRYGRSPGTTILLCAVVAGVGGGLLLDVLDLHVRSVRERKELTLTQARTFGRAILSAILAYALFHPTSFFLPESLRFTEYQPVVAIIAIVQLLANAFPPKHLDHLGRLVSRLILVRAIFTPALAGEEATAESKYFGRVVRETLGLLRLAPGETKARRRSASEASADLLFDVPSAAEWVNLVEEEDESHIQWNPNTHPNTPSTVSPTSLPKHSPTPSPPLKPSTTVASSPSKPSRAKSTTRRRNRRKSK